MATFEDFADEVKRLSRDLKLNAIWLRAKCRCEYCGDDLLGSHAIYRGAESDHILPQRKYPRLVDKLNNYAMACSSCHKLKGSRFDPGDGDDRWQGVDDLTDEQRTELIEVVKRRLVPLLKEQDSWMTAARKYFLRG